jgi:hypothetical protein
MQVNSFFVWNMRLFCLYKFISLWFCGGNTQKQLILQWWKILLFFWTTEENPNLQRYEVAEGTKTASETSETNSGKTYPSLL